MTSLEFISTESFTVELCHLETKRLSLQLISENHIEELFNLMANPAITTYLTWPPHESREITSMVISSLVTAKENDTGMTWVVFYDGKICGVVSLIDIRRRHRLWYINRAELSYWLAPEVQKRGLMTEACEAVLDFSFRILRFHKIIVAHASDNADSKNLIQRLGFQLNGIEKEAFRKEQSWHDLVHYQMLLADWRKGGNNYDYKG